MKLLDLTLPTPAENLALDEALLETAETLDKPCEVLRLWESSDPIVVVGRASRVEEEVNVRACGETNIPILRRHSGGAAIVAGPGCLMYAVILSYTLRPHLRMIDQAHAFVLEKMQRALQPLDPSVRRRGVSDLTIRNNAKFSGNSLRCSRSHLLYHGTLLYDCSLGLIEQCLKEPPRQPEYRERRSHSAFVTNLAAPRDAIREAVIYAWNQDGDSLDDWPRAFTAKLAAEKYESDEWNLGR